MTNSVDRSKSKLSRGYQALIVLAAFIVLSVLFGPSLALYAALAHVRSSVMEKGFFLDYDRAGAGLLFSSVSIQQLRLARNEGGTPVLSFDLLRLEKPSVKAIYRLAKNPEQAGLESIARLAGGLRVENFDFTAPQARLRLESLAASTRALSDNQAQALKFPPETAPREAESLASRSLAFSGHEADELALIFDNIRLTGLSYDDANGAAVELGLLETRSSGEQLTLLRLENLTGKGGRTGFEVGAMTAGGVDIAALRRLFSSKESFFTALTFCDTLDLVQGGFSLGGQDILKIRTAVFDLNEDQARLSFSRNLELYANLAALTESGAWLAQEPAFMALMEAGGGSVDINLNLNLEYQPDGGRVDLRDFRLESPGLGRLELGGRLSGVAVMKPSFTPYQLLFTSESWNLEAFSLSYGDAGFMPAFYRALDKSIFKQAASRQSAVNLMDYYVQPLAAQLEEENGLANLPALVSETRAFLGRPENISFSCAPLAPLTVLSLAKLDKYDIIDRLNLSVQINQRAPVTVMTTRGVEHERLPSAPRALEKSFLEENI